MNPPRDRLLCRLLGHRLPDVFDGRRRTLITVTCTRCGRRWGTLTP